MHEIKITRPAKILFPKDGITKGELVEYYRRIAPWMLPYLQHRPLTLQRFPDGIDKSGFFQKSAAPYYPSWIHKVTVKKSGGTVQHPVCDDADTLVYLANQACIVIHPWLSRVDSQHHPGEMIFDLDPSTQDLTAVIDGAHMLKDILDSLDLPVYLKSTGSRGLHIVVPLDGAQDFEAVRGFARTVAELLVERDPTRFTLEIHKAKRGRRVFVDINRNAYAQTAVAPYSVRARDGAPIAMPLAWSDLRELSFRPDGITVRTVFDHLGEATDPWKDFRRRAVSLEQARHRVAHDHAA
jgi:bifunctional non-homologous end joining protein LigD